MLSTTKLFYYWCFTNFRISYH